MRTMTSAEAQNHFGMLLDVAQREPVTITRRGRPVAYLFSPTDYAVLKQGNNLAVEQSTSELLASFRGSGKGGSAARLVAEREAERQLEA